ncbi:MAG: serine/threonine protein kinase [Deltaproteobacteria bacterium]|nr:serine/threonine protein kinase [Deltaproteobacteria bacterium]
MAGRYEIIRPIGSGGAAEVFEAALRSSSGTRRVALKRLVSMDESEERSFLDEVRIVSVLRHENIVGGIEAGMMDGRLFLVTELVDGLDLETAVTRARAFEVEVPIELALHVALETARALEHAHDALDEAGQPLEIVHRDVSPENVLLSWQGDVKLADFGIAYALGRIERTRAGTAKGKLSYMAPEQLEGQPVDRRTDLFGLGCTLHAILTGRSVIRDPAQRARDVDSSIPADLAFIISKATEPDRTRRFSGAAAIGAALRAALAARGRSSGRETVQSFLASIREAEARTDKNPVASAPVGRADLFGLGLFSENEGGRPKTAILPGHGEGAPGDDSPPEPDTVETGKADTFEGVRTEIGGLTETPPQTAEGSVLHGFRLEELISRGSTARLFRARHTVLRTVRAVKVVHPELIDAKSVQQRFRREAELLARVDHPNIVKVFDFGTAADGAPFLVMELVDGWPLSRLLKSGRVLPLDRAASLFRQMLAGLEAAHASGVVHRDLKPSNIMIVDGPPEQLKIVDFGIARELVSEEERTRLTRTGLLGTPSYMAPEQISGARTADARADLYSLGCVLYAMLAGGPPFGTSIVRALEGHLHETPPPLGEARGLERVAHWLLEKQPVARPASARAVLEALDELSFTGQAVPIPALRDDRAATPGARPASTPPRVLSISPGPLLLAAAAGTLVAAGVGMGWALRSGARVEAPSIALDASEAALDTSEPAASARELSASAARERDAGIAVDVTRVAREPRRPPAPPPIEPLEPSDLAGLDADAESVLRKLDLASLREARTLLGVQEAGAYESARAGTDLGTARVAAQALVGRLSSFDVPMDRLQSTAREARSKLDELPEQKSLELEREYLEIRGLLRDGADREARVRLFVRFSRLLERAARLSSAP